MQPLRVLLNGLIDYAGMFPPAQLPMRGAVQHYAGYRRGDWAWVLGRFVLPVARMEEFEPALQDLADESWRSGPWRLSALVGRSLEADLRKILDFNRRHAESPTRPSCIESIEVKVLSVEDVQRAADLVSDAFDLYVEVPVASDPDVWIGAARDAGVRVKVRTGGVAVDLIPAVPDLARFLTECARAKVPFKATAGLHHPLRSFRALTSEPNGPSAVMHGFLNVFLAAAFVSCGGMGLDDAVSILADEVAEHFVFAEKTVSWRSYHVDAETLRTLRRTFAIGFGACSVEDPIDDLKALGFLND
jgi:hypothetical protein